MRECAGVAGLQGLRAHIVERLVGAIHPRETSHCSSPSAVSTKVAHTMKLPVFKIDEREQEGGVVLALSGELDLAGAPSSRRRSTRPRPRARR